MMRRSILLAAFAAATLLLAGSPSFSNAQDEKKDEKKDDKKDKKTPIYPTALFVFEERGSAARDLGQKVVDLLFAKLVVKDGLSLVDREDIKKTLSEAQLNLSGAVKAAEATKVGQLTGAKILVTGS